MQFQVHEPGDDALTRTCSGRAYSKALPAQPVKKRTVVRVKSLPSPPYGSLVESSTEGMDSEEGQEISRQLYKRIDQLGLSKGSASLGSVIKTDKTMSFPQVKEALREPTRPPVEPVPELNGTRRPTILDVPAFQEVPELGIKGTNIHPPQLVEDLDSDNLRGKRGELVQPKPQYSIQTVAEQSKQGIHPEIGEAESRVCSF